jgi:hypothetical protein
MEVMSKPKNFDQLYPGRFLKAGSFEGKRVTLKIKDYDREMLKGEDGAEKMKAIISFEETPYQLVACKTNGLCMRAMFGDNLPDWVGKRVILFPSIWNGEPCIRVWGSPDIPEATDLEIKLPRRKPFTMRLHTSAAEETKP